MADTGAPLFLALPTHGEGNWDDDLNAALTAINTQASTVLTALAAKADLVSGKVPSGQIPSLSAITVTPVANQTARLAFSSATVGTAVLQLDNGNIYVLTATPYSTNGNWSAVNPGLVVASINGETGVVTGYVKLAGTNTWPNPQTFTVSPSVPTATASDAPVPKAQLDAAIAGVSGGAATKYTTTFGNGSLTTFTFTHGRGSADVLWNVYEVSTGVVYWPDSVTVTSTQITLTFTTAPTTNQYRLVVI
jgi:hypothetical protein